MQDVLSPGDVKPGFTGVDIIGQRSFFLKFESELEIRKWVGKG